MGCGASADEQGTTSAKAEKMDSGKYEPVSGWRLKLRPEEVGEAGVVVATLGADGMYRAAGNPLSGVEDGEPMVETGMRVEITLEFWYCMPSELVDEDTLASLDGSNVKYYLHLHAHTNCPLECEGGKGYKAYKYHMRSSRFTVGNPGSHKQLSTALADSVTKLGWRTPGGDPRGIVVLAAADKAWQHSEPPIKCNQLPSEGFHLFNVTSLVHLKDADATPEKEKKAPGMSAEQVLALKQKKKG